MNSPLKDSTVLVLVDDHLANAPRPQKEVLALRKAGAHVAVRGAWWNPVLAAEDLSLARSMDVDFAPVIDLRGTGVKGLLVRLRWRLAREGLTHLGLVTARTLGIGAPEFLRAARQVNADLTMVHSEGGLWVGKELLEEGRRVGVDFEDWYSQDLLPADRQGRPIAALQALERRLLQQAQCCLTTSQALAGALASDASSDRVPTVIPNCFPAAMRDAALAGPRDPRPIGTVSFHWFSQIIGPGRGLEILAQALPQLRGNWLLTLRGARRGYEDWHNRTFPESVRPRIRLFDRVPNDELLARTMSHDVGLALEVPYCPSRDLTATNKIFEYMRAGLAIIATGTRGQEEVMRASPTVGTLVPPGDPAALAAAMQNMLDDPDFLRDCRQRSAAAGMSVWSWETHEPTLVRAISDGLARP
jgi:glycosyltransferase involved in cell wall biosynthesis